MSNTTSNQGLSERIERLVQQHIAESRRAAQEAVERAFAGAAGGRSGTRPRPRVKPANDKRRTPEEIAAVGERFYEVVCAKPGETMAVLAADVGASAADLNRPMTLLKQKGRIRSAGSRSRTRYFPMANEVEPSA